MIFLNDLRREVLAGNSVEHPWELFRLANFPGRDHDEAVAELGQWAQDNGIEIEFGERQLRSLPVIYILFKER